MCTCRGSHQRPINPKMGTWNQHSIIRRNLRIPNHRINQNTIKNIILFLQSKKKDGLKYGNRTY